MPRLPLTRQSGDRGRPVGREGERGRPRQGLGQPVRARVAVHRERPQHGGVLGEHGVGVHGEGVTERVEQGSGGRRRGRARTPGGRRRRARLLEGEPAVHPPASSWPRAASDAQEGSVGHDGAGPAGRRGAEDEGRVRRRRRPAGRRRVGWGGPPGRATSARATLPRRPSPATASTATRSRETAAPDRRTVAAAGLGVDVAGTLWPSSVVRRGADRHAVERVDPGDERHEADRSGRAEVDLPPLLEGVRVRVRAPGGGARRRRSRPPGPWSGRTEPDRGAPTPRSTTPAPRRCRRTPLPPGASRGCPGSRAPGRVGLNGSSARAPAPPTRAPGRRPDRGGPARHRRRPGNGVPAPGPSGPASPASPPDGTGRGRRPPPRRRRPPRPLGPERRRSVSTASTTGAVTVDGVDDDPRGVVGAEAHLTGDAGRGSSACLTRGRHLRVERGGPRSCRSTTVARRRARARRPARRWHRRVLGAGDDGVEEADGLRRAQRHLAPADPRGARDRLDGLVDGAPPGLLAEAGGRQHQRRALGTLAARGSSPPGSTPSGSSRHPAVRAGAAPAVRRRDDERHREDRHGGALTPPDASEPVRSRVVPTAASTATACPKPRARGSRTSGSILCTLRSIASGPSSSHRTLPVSGPSRAPA